jgi:DNA-binding beta-propeller fold protein YncE
MSRRPLSHRLHRPSLALVCIVLSSAAVAGAQTPLKVLDRWKIGGTGSWSSVAADGENNLLYATHGTRVEVIDTRTGKVAGAVSGLKEARGVSLDPDGEAGYISDSAANAIVVFDRKTRATLDAVPAGTGPDGIAFEPQTRTVWAFNVESENVTVMDTRDRAVLGTVKLPGKPGLAAADGHGQVFVTMRDTNQLVRLAASSREVTATWSVDGCGSATGLAYDEAHKRLFAACDANKLAVLDAKSGQVLATPTIGAGGDAVVYQAKGELVLNSNADGTLSVIDARPGKGFKTVETLPTQKGARTMAYQAQTDRVFLPVADLGDVPTATADAPHPEAAVVPDSFTILVVGRK